MDSSFNFENILDRAFSKIQYIKVFQKKKFESCDIFFILKQHCTLPIVFENKLEQYKVQLKKQLFFL